MRVNQNKLFQELLRNVLEIKFIRRIDKPGFSPYRRMLCTNCSSLLNSTNGRISLHYRQPQELPKFNPASKNIVLTWDIFMQDYRCINAKNCEIVRTIPAGVEFWLYFNENLKNMTPAQKISFMNS